LELAVGDSDDFDSLAEEYDINLLDYLNDTLPGAIVNHFARR